MTPCERPYMEAAHGVIAGGSNNPAGHQSESSQDIFPRRPQPLDRATRPDWVQLPLLSRDNATFDCLRLFALHHQKAIRSAMQGNQPVDAAPAGEPPEPRLPAVVAAKLRRQQRARLPAVVAPESCAGSNLSHALFEQAVSRTLAAADFPGGYAEPQEPQAQQPEPQAQQARLPSASALLTSGEPLTCFAVGVRGCCPC